MYTKLAFESSSVHKRSAQRVSRFYESNESMISESKSNPQNNRKIHFTLQLFYLNPLDICVLLHVLLLVLNFKSYSLLFIIQIFSLLVCEGSFGKVQQLL